jgi:hypothetical protein
LRNIYVGDKKIEFIDESIEQQDLALYLQSRFQFNIQIYSFCIVIPFSIANHPFVTEVRKPFTPTAQSYIACTGADL